MTKKELLKVLIAVPDETVILVDSGEGSFLEGAIAGVGICNPDSEDVDGLYTELWDFNGGEDAPRNTPDNCFPVLALSPKSAEFGKGQPVYELGYEI